MIYQQDSQRYGFEPDAISVRFMIPTVVVLTICSMGVSNALCISERNIDNYQCLFHRVPIHVAGYENTQK